MEDCVVRQGLPNAQGRTLPNGRCDGPALPFGALFEVVHLVVSAEVKERQEDPKRAQPFLLAIDEAARIGRVHVAGEETYSIIRMLGKKDICAYQSSCL